MRLLAMAVVATMLVPASLEAQRSTTVGLGLGLQNSSLILDEELNVLNSLTPTVYVPIVLANGIMVEPGVAFLRVKTSEEDDFGEREFTGTAMRLGVGVLFVLAAPERGRVYAGPRVGITRISSSNEVDGDEIESSRMDLFFSAVLGGEFFLMPAFSLGGEAGLTYVTVGETERDPEPPFDSEEDVSMLALGTEFRVRWYIH